MTSPSSSTRFTLLPTDYLASQPPAEEITLQSLIDTSDRMAEEAREALPYSFDECTYSKGYLRQAVWSCLDCGEKGVCYGCSISCHAEHKLVELWTKRHFQCDCPTTSMQPEPTSSGSKRRRCTLNPPEEQPQLPNEENVYSHNFKGEFCRCGREYDAETETEAMLTCIACEDWFHETCLNLRSASLPVNATSITTIPTGIENGRDSTSAKAEGTLQTNNPPVTNNNVTSSAPIAEGADDEDEDEDEETAVLIPSESYDGLICAACVKKHPYLRSKAGSERWMIIEPSIKTEWEVVGRKVEKEENGGKVGEKRSVEDGEESESKRVKANGEEGNIDKVEVEDKPEWRWKGKGDIFLANGIREKLKSEVDEKTIKSLPFPLEDEEIYEPPKDEEEDETLEQVTERVVSSLPRVQAIEALHGYNRLKERIVDMLRTHVESGQSVSKADIEQVFERLQQQRRE